MNSFEELFIIRLKHRMSDNKDNRDANLLSRPKRLRLAEIVSASILAILSSGGMESPVKSYRNGIWKHSDIQKFISNHIYFLSRVFPSLEQSPSETTVRNCLTININLDDFVDSFIQWTKEVSQFHESIKPCSEETAKIGFNSKPARAIILAVYAWKQQNPEVERIVNELFSDSGKARARAMLGSIY